MSKVTRLLYSAGTLAGDKERPEEIKQIIAALDKIERDLVTQDMKESPDEKVRAALLGRKARLVDRAKDLYHDITGFPMRLGD